MHVETEDFDLTNRPFKPGDIVKCKRKSGSEGVWKGVIGWAVSETEFSVNITDYANHFGKFTGHKPNISRLIFSDDEMELTYPGEDVPSDFTKRLDRINT